MTAPATATNGTDRGAIPRPVEMPRSGTRFPELFDALSREFPREDIKIRKMGGRDLYYVTARTVMNRLDHVLGPENWETAFSPWGEDAVLCVLTVTLPDGSKVTKQDVGANSTMTDKVKGADPGDDDKGGTSDALKRAAVMFGVARYLYGDGIAEFPRPAPADNGSGHATGKYASPEQTKLYRDKLETYLRDRNARWIDRWQDHITGEAPEGAKELCNLWQADNHLVKWAIETGRLDRASMPDDRSTKNAQICRFTAILYHRSTDERRALTRELDRYIDEQEARQGELLRAKHPHLFGDQDESQAMADDEGRE